MVIVNPKTGSRFFSSCNREDLINRNYSQKFGYIFKNTEKGIEYIKKVYDGTDIDKGKYAFVSNSQSLQAIEIDKNDRLCLYDDDVNETAFPIVFKLLKVTFNNNEVNYEEFIVNNESEPNLSFFLDSYKRENTKDFQIITNIMNDFFNLYPELELRELCNNGDYYNLRTNLIYEHRYMYEKNPKYKALVNNGFVKIISQYVGYTVKTVNSHVEEIYDYLKDVQYKDIPVDTKIYLDKYKYDNENMLKLLFKYNFNLADLKEYKTVMRGFGNKALQIYIDFLKIINKHTSHSNREVLNIIRKNTTTKKAINCGSAKKKRVAPSNLLVLFPDIINIRGEDFLEKMFLTAEDAQDWVDVSNEIEVEKQKIISKLFDKNLTDCPYKNDCNIDESFVIPGSKHLNYLNVHASMIKNGSDLLPEESIQFFNYLGRFFHNTEDIKEYLFPKIFLRVRSNHSNTPYKNCFIVILDVKSKSMQIIASSECIFEWNERQDCGLYLKEKYMMQFYEAFLNRSI